ncbi:MAG: cytochrome c biogenesis protein CcsA [Verrucomicrobiales bacterium]
MTAERLALMLSTLCFLGAFAAAAYCLLRGTYRKTWPHRLLMFAGFAGQCWVLYLRGRELGRCPITSPWELLVFVSWGIVLIYWLIGPAYRLSLLGVFTSPLVWIFQTIALGLQGAYTPQAGDPIFTKVRPDPWLEWHATVSLLAYAAFALAAIAGVMFLIQERQLKRHRLNPIFYNLPPLQNLAKGLVRLLTLGLVLLTAGIATAYLLEKSPAPLKLALSWLVWAVYLAILLYQWMRGWPHRRLAGVSTIVFLLPLATLWVVSGR